MQGSGSGRALTCTGRANAPRPSVAAAASRGPAAARGVPQTARGWAGDSPQAWAFVGEATRLRFQVLHVTSGLVYHSR